MSDPTVRRLVISDPSLQDPITVDLPWDLLPESMQQELQRLDKDHNQLITYSPAVGRQQDQYVEAGYLDASGLDLSRLFWRYGGDSPFNNRDRDRGTLEDRQRTLHTVQDRLFDQLVLPMTRGIIDLGGDQAIRRDKDSWKDRWEGVQRSLELTGDVRHLFYLSEVVEGEVLRTADNALQYDYLEIEEALLLAAERMAAGTREGREQFLVVIQNSLKTVGNRLDQRDGRNFREQVKSPYLLAGMGAPVTADAKRLAQGGETYFEVAVPASYLRDHPDQREAAIRRFFEEEGHRISVRGSRFEDQRDPRLHDLIPTSVTLDRPGPGDDRQDSDSTYSFHIQQDRLNRSLFGGQTMVYYRVGFRLPDATQLIDGREIRKCDVLIGRGTPLARVVQGGFVLQDKEGKESHDIFASDTHLSERNYEVVKVMAEDLRRGGPIDQEKAEAVERFYESVNEQMEAAVEIWNEGFRATQAHMGETEFTAFKVDRVFITGDLADFVNIAATLEHQGYRSTNIRRLKETLSRVEAPLYLVAGNHDYHGFPFALSEQGNRNFYGETSLRGEYEEHYDDVRIPGGASIANGIRSLQSWTSSNIVGVALNSFMEANAQDPNRPNDAFLDHHLREIVGGYESYRVHLGNRVSVFVWPTETEDFNYVRYAEEDAHPPVIEEIDRSRETYFDKRLANGKGPRPEILLAFLREMQVARDRGERVILAGHFPPFFAGTGPGSVPDSEDSLRGTVAQFLRLAAWHYRLQGTGMPVLAASIAGHVHTPTETDEAFNLSPIQTIGLHTALERIFAQNDAQKILVDIHELVDGLGLNGKVTIRRVTKPGLDGWPGPILQEFNRDSDQYGLEHGTVFLTLPAVGPPGSSGQGEMGFSVVTTRPDGKVEVGMKFFRVRPDGQIRLYEGSELQRLERERWVESRDWDRRRQVPPYEAITEKTNVEIERPGGHEEPNPDWFSMICQYTHQNFCLDLDVGAGGRWGASADGWSLPLGGQLVFTRTLFAPQSTSLNTFIGPPNDFRLGAAYDPLRHRTQFIAGTDVGIPQFFALVDTDFSGSPILALDVRVQPALPVIPVPYVRFLPFPGVRAWVGSDLHGNLAGGAGLQFDAAVMAARKERRLHWFDFLF